MGRESNCDEVRRELERGPHDRFDLEHTTLQVHREGGELLSIETPEQRERRVPPN